MKDMCSNMLAEAYPLLWLVSVLYVSAQALLKTYACLVFLQWSSNGCSADCKSVAFGVGGSNPSHCKKMCTARSLRINLGVAGSIPVSLTYETVAQLGEHVVWQMPNGHTSCYGRRYTQQLIRVAKWLSVSLIN